MLLEIDSHRVLIDPVWSETASPLEIFGSKRYFPPPLPLEELPDVDAVLISHDHYDHLDMPTVKALAARGVRWLVPLGVGAHLEAWGVPEGTITELEWWQSVDIGRLTLTATPARHFSGRGITNGGSTLWSGWAIAGPKHRVFYSGDTGMHGWTEPIERVLAAARLHGVRVAAPRPGEMVEPATLGAVIPWWPQIPWQSGEEAPVVSTGLEHPGE